MIVLLAVDNGLDKSVSQSVLQLKFPDDTEFQSDRPAHGWITFTTPAQKHYMFQAAYVVAIMADDQPALDAFPALIRQSE